MPVATVSQAERRKLLAQVHCAKRDLGLSDEEYRALLDGAAGVRSAALIKTDRDFSAVLAAFRAAGWRGTGRLRGREAKCYALWCRLADAGAVRARSYAAMRAWVARVCGEQDVYRADQWAVCVEALKRWVARVGHA